MSATDELDVAGRTVLRTTRSILERQHEAVREAAWRTSVVHWFDERLLAALCEGDLTVPPDTLMVVLESLPFIEVHAEGRLRHHSQVRAVLRAAMDGEDPRLALRLEQAVVDELRERLASTGLDPDEAIELAYHVLAHDEAEGVPLVEAVFDTYGDARDAAHLDLLVQRVRELADAGRLGPLALEQSRLWDVWAAAAAGDQHRAAKKAETALGSGLVDEEVVDRLTWELAYAEWSLGKIEAAIGHASEVADRRRDMLGVQARMLLGDMRPVPTDALDEYARALEAAVSLYGAESTPDGTILDVEQWGIVDFDDGDPEAPPVAVGFGTPDGVLNLLDPHPLYAELWLRIGASEAKRGKLDVARRWLAAASILFDHMNDGDGVRRVESNKLLLATHLASDEQLRKVVEMQEAVVAWARANAVPAVELDALLDLAEAYRTLGNEAGADECLHEAARLAEELDDPASQVRVAHERTIVAINRGEIDEAMEEIARARALSLDPEVRIRFDRLEAEAFFEAGDTQLARRAFDEALRGAEQRGDAISVAIALNGLARVHWVERDLATAEKHFRRALELAVDVDATLALDLRMSLSEVLRLRRQDDEAEALEATVEQVADELGLKPTIARLTLSRADRALRRHDGAAAVLAYDAAVERFDALGDRENELAATLGLASGLSCLGRHDEALAVVGAALAMAAVLGRPIHHARALDTKATVLVDAERYDEAIEALEEAHRAVPEDPVFCTDLGWAHLRADRIEASLAWSRKALELDPGNAFPYRNIGHALLVDGRLEEAKDAYRRAISGRFGDMGFRDTLDELAHLRRRHPELHGLDEIEAWFRDVEAELDTAT